MTDDAQNLWETRPLPAGIRLELRAGGEPALVLVQGENRVRVALTQAKGVVAGLVDAAADLAEVLAGGPYHA
jgi:hypothetical protein